MCAAGLAGPWSLGPEMPARPVRAGVPASSESWLAGISLAGSGVAERRENTEKMDCPGRGPRWWSSGYPLPRAIAMPSFWHPHLAMTTDFRQRCGRVRSVTEWPSSGLAIALSNVALIMQLRFAGAGVTDWSVRRYWPLQGFRMAVGKGLSRGALQTDNR